MKRKFDGDPLYSTSSSMGSIYGAPHLESTMLINTGGKENDGGCVGYLKNIPVSASISSGTRLFQYNRFFWNKDLFTHNFNNCCTFIILSWFDSIKGVSTMFYPVFLPQTTITMYQSMQSGVTYDPAVKKRFIDDLVYYLNGMWTGGSHVNPANTPLSTPPEVGAFNQPPSFYTYHYKGFISPTTNNADFPFFVNNGSAIPPLIWKSLGSNQNIVLMKNPDYWWPGEGSPVIDKDCAFQFVNPYEGWTISRGNPNNKVVKPNGVTSVPLINSGGCLPSTYRLIGNSNKKGWCGRGSFSTGFGQADDPHISGAYSDLYGDYYNPILQDLWINYTKFVGKESPIKMTGVQWYSFCENHYLVRDVIVAYFLPQFLPSRYIIITSDTLSRTQKLLTISNSPIFANPSIIGIQYLTLDGTRTYTDATLSGQNVGGAGKTSGGSIGGRSGGDNDTPVLAMNPFYSIQSVDFVIQDEFSSIIQNFRTPNSNPLTFKPNYSTFYEGGIGLNVDGSYIMSYVMGENSFVLDNSGGFTANVTTFPIPTWLSSLNPLNIVSVPPPSQQPLMAPFSCYNAQWLYMLFAIGNAASALPDVYHDPDNIADPNPTVVTYVNPSPEFSPSMPYSGNIIHFGRVLGY
jgi:hypothetical protein